MERAGLIDIGGQGEKRTIEHFGLFWAMNNWTGSYGRRPSIKRRMRQDSWYYLFLLAYHDLL